MLTEAGKKKATRGRSASAQDMCVLTKLVHMVHSKVFTRKQYVTELILGGVGKDIGT